jgi:hypothetical protein
MKRGRKHPAERKTKKQSKLPVRSSRRRGEVGTEEADEEEKFTYQKTFTQNDDN